MKYQKQIWHNLQYTEYAQQIYIMPVEEIQLIQAAEQCQVKIINANCSEVDVAEHLAKLDTLSKNKKDAVSNTLKNDLLLSSWRTLSRGRSHLSAD
jgi:hypothetical protein